MFKQQKQHKQAAINYPIIFDRISPRYAFDRISKDDPAKGFYYDSRLSLWPLMSAAPPRFVSAYNLGLTLSRVVKSGSKIRQIWGYDLIRYSRR